MASVSAQNVSPDATSGSNGIAQAPSDFYSLESVTSATKQNGKAVILGRVTIWARSTLKNSGSAMYIYPNPVETETHFKYTMAQDQSITIQLVDMQGKLLKTFADNLMQAAGEYDSR